MSVQKAVIIIPTYNEKENISRLIPVLLEQQKIVAKKWDLHILVVDDSSPDGTAAEVESITKQLKTKQVHLYSNPKKSGLGHAYLTGMKEAFNVLKADVVFEFDADFSHDPTRIPLFLRKIDEGYDFVIGSRYIQGGSIPSDWGTDRKFLSVVGNVIIMLVLGNFHIRDWTSGYRCIRKSVYEAVKDEMDKQGLSGYTFQVGFLHKSVRRGFKIVEVPFQFIDRTVGSSKIGKEYITNNLQYIFTQRFLEITQSRIFKFAVVGGIGFVINTAGLFIFSHLNGIANFATWLHSISHLEIVNVSGVSSALGAEFAIVSNFILNNLWTFADRKPKNIAETVSKFAQFNLSSFGAVLLQFIIVGAGTHITGSTTLYKLLWLLIATAIGMILNFVIYSKVIWKKK